MKIMYDPIQTDIFFRHSTLINPYGYYHQHDACEIYLLINGDANYYIDHSCYHISRGTLLVIQPGEYHRVELRSRYMYERTVINIKKSLFDIYSSPQTDLSLCFLNRFHGEHNMAQLNEQQLKEFIILTTQLGASLHEPDYGKDLMAISVLLQILVRTNQLFMEQPAVSPPDIMPALIRDVLTYCNNHLTENITLSSLSSLFFHNGTYISRRFKEITGLTLQEYIIMKRIALAQKHLRQGCSVTDSCMLSGFNNCSNFSRTFSKQVGCSPREYQKLHFTPHKSD